MSKERKCPECGSEIGIDDDRCQTCGAHVPLTHPWYTYPVGGLIVLLLAWLLIDVDGLWQYLSKYFE